MERSSKDVLDRWEICQLEKELDEFEANCIFEVTTGAEMNGEFIQEVIHQLRDALVFVRRNLNTVEISQKSLSDEFSERLNRCVLLLNEIILFLRKFSNHTLFHTIITIEI